MKKVITYTLLTFMLVFMGAMVVNPAGALTYQDETDVEFTFNSTLSLSLSSASMMISDLTPGQSGTSNSINVVVNTNNVYGYNLSATVGSSSTDYRDLKHTNGTDAFSSIAVGSNVASLPTNGNSVWGFVKTTNGTTWSNYNGLPKYDDAVNTVQLNSSTGAAVDATTGFKIGAFAKAGQLAGDYSNVINFIAVANAGS